MSDSIRDILRVYSLMESQLREAKGKPLTVNDFLANRELNGERKDRIAHCIQQLRKKKIIARVPVHNPFNKKERYGYIHKDYFPKKAENLPAAPELLSAHEAELAAQEQEQKQTVDDVRLRVNKDKSVTVTIGHVRITIEVEGKK